MIVRGGLGRDQFEKEEGRTLFIRWGLVGIVTLNGSVI
mgnify:CR=1 FL=1